MAILKMKRMKLIGFNNERKAVIEDIHKYGHVQINAIDAESLGLDTKETASSISRFDSYMNTAETALEILGKYVPEEKEMFSSRPSVDISKYSMSTTEADKVLHQCNEIIRMSRKIQENKENITRIIAKQEALEPYKSLDVPMQFKGTKTTVSKVGTLSGEWSADKIQSSLAEVKSSEFEILSSDKLQTCLWIICLKTDADALDEWERKVQFSTPQFSLSHRVPVDKINVLSDAEKTLTEEIKECEEGICNQADKRDDIQMLYDHLMLRKEKYEALSKFGLTKNTFYLDAFVPEKYLEKLTAKLQKNYKVYIETYYEQDEEEIPKAFENNGFASPVEGITETYSMPSAIDIDPNPIMAFFYYLFFGMMFSDAGYGLLVMLVCGILAFGKRLEPKDRRTYKMFFFCGISTTFWGFMYGSFFGDAVTKVSQMITGGAGVTLKPIWIDPVNDPLTLLVVSVALGLIQIVVGLSIKMYMYTRAKRYMEAICDVGLWIVVLLGVAVLAIGKSFAMDIVFNIGAGIACVGAFGLVCTQGRSQKNIIAKLFSGILSLYDITSYVSDALSYARLMALGLTTAVIANVVNTLGSMSKGVVGVIVFIIVFILGHSLNFAINMLGAYVHTNRLQYVEFFGKFYEGGGKKFEPLKVDTKYHCFAGNAK